MIKMQFAWYMRWNTGVFFINLLVAFFYKKNNECRSF